jgi:uncharacterized protein with FMN-binding domain
MRKTLTLAAGAATLALPVADATAAAAHPAVAAAKAKTRVATATRSFTGQAGSAGRWGDLEVTIVVVKTTTTNLTTKKKRVTRKITAVKVPEYPDHTNRSVYINQQALPTLISETLQAQSTGIELVSGATDTSEAFQESLQSAILTAKAW